MHTTPRKIGFEVKQFCKEIAETTPVYVPVDPAPHARMNQCHLNVMAHIKEHGGEQEYGWIIWYWRKKVIEAEYHSVWRRPDGRLVDITPKRDGERQILFLPDNRLRSVAVQEVAPGIYRPVPNISKRLTETAFFPDQPSFGIG